MTRDCLHCKRAFEVDQELDAKIRARFGDEGHGHLVCAACVMARLDEMYAEQVMEMTDEEIEAELREDGVDVEAFAERTRKLLLDAMAKTDEPLETPTWGDDMDAPLWREAKRNGQGDE